MLLNIFHKYKIITLFPLVKIASLGVLYVLFGRNELFLYSISFIAVAFLLRLLTGNQYAISKKAYNDGVALNTYFTINISAAITFVMFSYVAISSSYYLSMLILSAKLLEAVLVVMLLEGIRSKKISEVYLNNLFIYLLLESLVFVCLVYYVGMVSALLVVLLSSLFVILCLVRRGNYIAKYSVKDLRYFAKNNYEMALTVLPVSIFFLCHTNKENIVLAGAFSLVFSLAGFLNRPLSLLAVNLNGLSIKDVKLLSHTFTILFITFMYVHLNIKNMEGVALIFSCALLLFSIALQNVARIYVFSTSHLKLYKYHIYEAILIFAICLMSFDIYISMVVLSLTRTFRLNYMDK